MHTSFYLIAAALGYVAASPAPQASTAPTGPFFLGSACSTSSQCLGGAQCYAVNSMLISRCGNLEASCTSDAQCAFNSCVSGFCNGPVAATLPLGMMCYESAQCAGGASCYAVNSMQIPTCGNFQAACSSNSQCAFNTCVGGFCSGMLSSASSASASSTTASTPTTVVTPKPLATGTGTATVQANSTMPTATRAPTATFTGGAGERLYAGLGSVVIGSAAAFALMIVM